MFGELLALLFGQNAAEALRDSGRSRASQPARQTSTLMGVVSAGLGSFGLLLGLLVARMGPMAGARPSTSFAGLAVIAVIGLACSCVGFYFGRKAQRLASRHPGIARYGTVASAIGAAASVVLLAGNAARVFQ